MAEPLLLLLLKRFERARVDLLERLPAPFGLVRSGVAPDHPETKIVTNQFTRVASGDRCNFFGNVTLGADVSLAELRQLYHGVILAYGAEGDRTLGIPGEGLSGITSAREFVWWYNGHPDQAHLAVDLTSTDTAVVLGQGNVALDVARVLLRSVDELAATDIAEHTLEALRASTIRRVVVVGRRGPVQAACTAKELRELLGLKGVHVSVRAEDLHTSAVDKEEMKLSRSHRRVFELLTKAAAQGAPPGGASSREVEFKFFRTPVEFLPRPDDAERVGGVRLERTVLQGKERRKHLRVHVPSITGQLSDRSAAESWGGQGQAQQAVGVGEIEDLPAGLVLRSIGYKSLPVPGLPFDSRRGVVPNESGRVVTPRSEDGGAAAAAAAAVKRGLYVVGWLKRGPTGIIGTNLIDAEDTVASIAEDVERDLLPPPGSSPAHGARGLQLLLDDKNVPAVSFQDWLKVDAEEVRRGVLNGKPREKITSGEDMLRVALSEKAR
eukprot:jgi/Mesen1/2033/ME000148S01135